MITGIIGKKLGMTQVFRENGKIEAVTAIETGPCIVVQVKTVEKDGYSAAQLGFGKAKKLNSAEKGHLKEAGTFRHLREFKIAADDKVTVGDKLDVSMFKTGDKVNVTGISRGKGFAGVVKRYHFKGGPATHGQSDRERHPGSIGSTTTPGHVWRGQKMAGHMGDAQATAQNLTVYQSDVEKNILLVCGAVPGGVNSLVLIKKSGRK